MDKVLNLPLPGATYDAVQGDGLRRINLPTTERTHRLLFGKDDQPRPYTRVNIRRGASGAPAQYTLVRYERTASGEYYVTLGEPIIEVDEESWVATIEVAMVDLVMSYLDSVRGYCAELKSEEHKWLSRAAMKTTSDYKSISQYSEAGRLAPELRKELAKEILSESIGIWRGLHKSIDTIMQGGDLYRDMRSEALLGVAYCDYLGYFHARRGRSLGNAYATIIAEVRPLLVNYAAPLALPRKALDIAFDAFDKALDRYRAKSVILTN